MENYNDRESVHICVIASFALYVISVFWPALVFANGDDVMTYSGFSCLINGPLSLVICQVTWLANPLWLLSIIKLARAEWRQSFVFSAWALFSAMNVFILFFQAFPTNEGGVGPWYKLTSLHVGFFLWIGSMLIVFLKAKWELKRAGNNNFGTDAKRSSHLFFTR